MSQWRKWAFFKINKFTVFILGTKQQSIPIGYFPLQLIYIVLTIIVRL